MRDEEDVESENTSRIFFIVFDAVALLAKPFDLSMNFEVKNMKIKIFAV